VRASILSAAGNSFCVLDVRGAGAPRDAAELARVLCADRDHALFRAARAGGLVEPAERALDGLLLVGTARGAADVSMAIYNADGSRPEACGNGLRCVGRFAREHGLVHGEHVRVETDAGLRELHVGTCGPRAEPGREVEVLAGMGRPIVVERETVIEVDGVEHRATLIDMGNPHCVLFVDDPARADVARLGPALERHARFPARTNVGFAALGRDALTLRVWERGVGETTACGTGACAAAVAAALVHGAALPLSVDLPGGRLRVHWDGRGEAQLEGPVRLHAEGALELDSVRGARP
jgi:diaminopimelate epimerase